MTFPFEQPPDLQFTPYAHPTPNWEDKIWGCVQHVFCSPRVAISVLQTLEGYRCSRHLHRRRDNRFIVLTGALEVWEWPNEEHVRLYPMGPSTVHTSEDVTIKAGKPHMFRVRQSGLVVEIYTPSGGPVDIDDIVRFDEGAAFDVDG